MKPSALSYPLITIFILLTAALPIQAQQADRPLIPLSPDNFDCMQNVHCLTENEALKEKGWVFVFDETVEKSTRELTAVMNGENISMKAIYNGDGSLVNATYRLQNFILPSALLMHLNSSDFDGWRMTGNEMVVNDFSAEQTEYRIIMKNGSETKTLRFNQSDIKNFAPYAGQLTEN